MVSIGCKVTWKNESLPTSQRSALFAGTGLKIPVVDWRTAMALAGLLHAHSKRRSQTQKKDRHKAGSDLVLPPWWRTDCRCI
jgi:hypothetical protein